MSKKKINSLTFNEVLDLLFYNINETVYGVRYEIINNNVDIFFRYSKDKFLTEHNINLEYPKIISILRQKKIKHFFNEQEEDD